MNVDIAFCILYMCIVESRPPTSVTGILLARGIGQASVSAEIEHTTFTAGPIINHFLSSTEVFSCLASLVFRQLVVDFCFFIQSYPLARSLAELTEQGRGRFCRGSR